MNFVSIPDLTQGAAAIDEDPTVDGEGYLEVEVETSGEMYVSTLFCKFLITVCHHRF